MSREQLKAIFIEEATEIIEKLDADIINYEEDPTNRELLNEIFRGVHTLKGNANAFGFTRLGEFVHHFEDLLDYYRSSNEEVPTNSVDIFLAGVDLIKETIRYEINQEPGVPEGYEKILTAIKEVIARSRNKTVEQGDTSIPPSQADLASEFRDFAEEGEGSNTFESRVKALCAAPTEVGATLYRVDLTFDRDIYFRGYDHSQFLTLLAEIGTIRGSVWDLSAVADLSSFVADEMAIPRVAVIIESKKPIDAIMEVFEFLFDHEYKVTQIDVAKESLDEHNIAANPPEPSAQNNLSNVTESLGSDALHPMSHQEDHEKSGFDEVNHPMRRREDREALAGQKSTIKIDTHKLDELFDTVGELVIAQNFIAQNEIIRSIDDEHINRTIETLSKITKLIQDRVMSLRMVAIRDTFEKMKRVVRDTSKKTGKEVRLQIFGEETEIDKTMIDSLSDPLVHIIRNAIDHGLEATREERIAAGKEPEGTVTLRAYHKSGSIIISISDDGRGINREKVLAKAIERGLVSPDEQLTDQQIYALIMQPGFSTAEVVSDVSGRGVGLDVVRASIEQLRGRIEIDSVPGKGTTFSMILPLTLAIIDGMLVKSAGEIYIIPTLTVVESFRPDKNIVHFFKGKGEFVTMRGEHIPVIRLADFFGLKGEKVPIWESTLICVETDRGRYAILVDELVGRQQVVIKSLGKSLASIREFAGGAILGNGQIALILNVEALCGAEANKQ